jgi:hypothetical protein
LSEQGIIDEVELEKLMLKADELSRILFAMIKNLSS